MKLLRSSMVDYQHLMIIPVTRRPTLQPCRSWHDPSTYFLPPPPPPQFFHVICNLQVHAAALSLMRLNSPHPALLSALSDRATALIEQTQRSYPDAHIRLTVENPGLSLSLITPSSQLSRSQLPRNSPTPGGTPSSSHHQASYLPQSSNQRPPQSQSSLRDLVTLLPPSLPTDIARRKTSMMIDSRQMGTLAFVFSRLNHLDPSFFVAYAAANSAEWVAQSRSPTLLAATALAISSVLQPTEEVKTGSRGSGGVEVERAGKGFLGQEWSHRVDTGGDSAASQQAGKHRTLFRDILAAARSKVRCDCSVVSCTGCSCIITDETHRFHTQAALITHSSRTCCLRKSSVRGACWSSMKRAVYCPLALTHMQFGSCCTFRSCAQDQKNEVCPSFTCAESVSVECTRLGVTPNVSRMLLEIAEVRSAAVTKDKRTTISG